MKTLLLSIAALVMLGLPATAFADTLTFQAPATAPNDGNGGANQFDLDHHKAYTWRIDNVNLANQTITGATLTFRSMSNWDTNPNMLFVHLLDTARFSGVQSFTDAAGTPVGIQDIQDNFAGSLFNSNPLVAAGTGNTFLTSRSFTTTPVTYTYTFTAAQIQVLSAYFASGNNIAFGFDPDCHFWNNGITFQMTTVPNSVPEPTTLALLGTGIGGFLLKRRRKNQQNNA
ncbi:MAG TPA: PEP-CTERM sorting domain-containing protein [Pyrinomonadaceae bacterium]